MVYLPVKPGVVGEPQLDLAVRAISDGNGEPNLEALARDCNWSAQMTSPRAAGPTPLAERAPSGGANRTARPAFCGPDADKN